MLILKQLSHPRSIRMFAFISLFYKKRSPPHYPPDSQSLPLAAPPLIHISISHHTFPTSIPTNHLDPTQHKPG